MPGRKFFHTTFFKLIFGLGLLGVVGAIMLRAFDLNAVWSVVSAFPLSVLDALIVMTCLVSFLKAARFHILIRHVGIKLSFLRSVRLFLASQAATPIPAGETIRAALLKQETGVSLGKAAGPVLAQAIYEIAAAVAVVFTASLFYDELFFPALIMMSVLIVLLGGLVHRPLFNRVLNLLVRLPFIHQHVERIRAGRDHFRRSFALLEGDGFDGHVLASIGLALLAQLVGGGLVLLAAQAFGLEINLFQTTLVYASGAILQGVFTIIPGGLGVTESGMSGILHLLGVDLSTALALVIIIRVATFLFPVVLGTLIFIPVYAKQTFIGQPSIHRHGLS